MPKDWREKQYEEIGQTAKRAFNKVGIANNYPEVRIVPGNHKMLRGGAVARAVLFESGKEAMYISSKASNSPKLAEDIEHEGLHFGTWRKFGPDVKEHGKEWMELCRQLASSPSVCRIKR